MKRTWTLWLVFACCAAIVIAAMAWVSLIVLRLEEATATSRQQALLEENTRLALWRMESMLAPFIAQENARPYYSYQAFFPAERAYTRMLARLEPNEILIPSPLLSEGSPHVRLYFQLGPAGELSSPQIPKSSLNGRALEGYSGTSQIEESARLLKRFADEIPRQALLDVAPSEWLPLERPNGTGSVASLGKAGGLPDSISELGSMTDRMDKAIKQTKSKSISEAPAVPKTQSQVNLAEEAIKNSPAQIANQIVTVPQQQEQVTRNDVEYQARLNTNIQRDISSANIQRKWQKQDESQKALGQQTASGEKPPIIPATRSEIAGKDTEMEAPDSIQPQGERQFRTDGMPARAGDSIAGRTQPRLPKSEPTEIKTSLLKPVWIHNDLILIRRVRVNQDEYLQGCWLDWPQIQAWLTDGIRDLFPQARLAAIKDGNDQARSLAALPVLIQPGPVAMELSPLLSPLRLSLWVAWLCVIAAISAAGILIRGMHTLSERRAAFVSAVTHELRTPLTTFRLYTEMLAEGMVPEEEQRRQYLNTLKQEADRQYHLIENVLAYSRMERGRYGGQKEILCLETWLERIQPRLAELAERSGMILVPANQDALTGLQLLTDAGALERILSNLVDNACKYAGAAADKRIHIDVEPGKKKVRIRVRDHGPGIDFKDIARLFQPFHKSARDAANSAPGVGLGLSLCRRLAQSIGGELSLEQGTDAGASFLLLLPRLQEKL
jgi:signal transduction histidine kinase